VNPQDYLEQVDRALADLSASDRERALVDLAELLDQLDGSAIGDPEQYAQAVREALAEPDDPARARWRPLGLPVELRPPDDERLMARAFDPRNPALLTPRMFGGGWAVNWGAVAVRLGLLRADDVDDEVLAAVPHGALLAARAVPLVLSGAAVGALAASWRALPARVPTSWSVGGRANGWGGRGSLVATAAAAVLPALWAQLPVPGNGERLVRAGRAGSLAVLAGASLLAALCGAREQSTGRAPDALGLPGTTGGHPSAGAGQGGRFGLLVPAAFPVAGATMLAVVVLPVRAGLRAVWRSRDRRTDIVPGEESRS